MSRPRRSTAAYLLVAAVDAVLAGGPESWTSARRVTKPMLMPTLMLRTGLGLPRLSAAQVCGWVGDVALLGDGPRSVRHGATAFAVGHGAYLAQLRRVAPADPSRSRVLARRLGAVWLATAPAAGLGAGRVDRALALPVMAYGAVVATLTSRALSVDPSLPTRPRRQVGTGAVLFLLSDSLLGATTFVVPQSPRQLEGAVMATYAIAQLLLADGLLGLAPSAQQCVSGGARPAVDPPAARRR